MALKRWLGAALIVSVFGIVGCSQPQPKDPASSPEAVDTTTTTTVTTETPVAMETPSGTETPSETATPADATATPAADGTPTADGTPAAAGGKEAILEDLELAEGMAGYEEVMKLDVPPSSPDAISKGKELFAANCALCHGDDAKGDGPGGANLDPPPRDLTATGEYKYGNMELALYRTGMYGIEGTGMAPWEGIIEPQDQWAITHYIRSIQQ